MMNALLKEEKMDVSKLTLNDTRASINRLRERRVLLTIIQEKKKVSRAIKEKKEFSLDSLLKAGIIKQVVKPVNGETN